jgi:hypothetical protein
MSEATYSTPWHPDHTATVRQYGLGGGYIVCQSVCPCGLVGQVHSGQAGRDSGTEARRRAEQDAVAHRRGMG